MSVYWQMNPTRLQSWHYFAFSAVLGLLLAYFNTALYSANMTDYGETIQTHRDFERLILRDVSLADGLTTKAFHDLTVCPRWRRLFVLLVCSPLLIQPQGRRGRSQSISAPTAKAPFAFPMSHLANTFSASMP
ncbi:MAG TPA: hypothetical protein VHP11_16390 [Tepidisphaeraceae bacterium]|nr:hypothetical protein [Tepidisphaeraceae bacterium]